MATDEVEKVQKLCHAIRNDNWEEVESLLNSFPGMVPNVYFWNRQTVLHVAAESDPPANILRQILRMVDIDFCSQPDEFGDTPLWLICEYGRDMDAIRLLVMERPQEFFEPSPRHDWSSPCGTLMYDYAGRGLDIISEVDIAQIIADVAEVWPDGVFHVEDGGKTLLQRAIPFSYSVNDFILLRTILAIQPELIEMIDYKGASAIHDAAEADDGDAAERLKLLLECGGSRALCVQDSNGQTPLHEACQSFTPRDTVMVLVANDPSVLNVRNKHGMTPLDTFRRRHQHFLRLGYTGLDWDENHNKLADTAMTLLTGAPVYCSDSPSLHELLHNQECTPDIAKLLIYALRDQASLKDGNGNGNVPLHIVTSRYSDDDFMYGEVIAALLEVYPAACQISNSEGTLPLQLLHRAGKSWSNGMKMVLLQHPAAVLDLELNHVARCSLLAKVGSKEQPDALFRLLQDAPVFASRANVL